MRWQSPSGVEGHVGFLAASIGSPARVAEGPSALASIVTLHLSSTQ